MWDVDSGQVVSAPLYSQSSLVKFLSSNGGRKRVESGSEDKTVRVWDLDSGEVVGKPRHGQDGQVW